MNQRKIGIVVQRYGEKVNGGAEVFAKLIAEKLNEKNDVTILTSRALDYRFWKPELSEGETIENGIKIIRFNHEQKATGKNIIQQNRGYKGRHLYQKFYRFLGKPAWYLKLFPSAEITETNQLKWVENEGPAMYDLINYLKENEKLYDAFIFITYLYYPSVVGLLTVPSKSIFIPTMHNEKAAYYPIFKKTMTSSRYLLFLTESEQKFSNKLFKIDNIKQAVITVGIDEQDDFKDNDVLKKYSINSKYIIYVGRIDSAKGCDILVKFFIDFINKNKIDLLLVLAGKYSEVLMMHPKIIYTGFISEYDKIQLMKQAEVLVIPSQYESLSLVLLESFACKTPVMVNGKCEVLKDHILKSNGGWVYENNNDFSKILLAILQNENIGVKANAGNKYVLEHYIWQKGLAVLNNAIDYVIASNRQIQ